MKASSVLTKIVTPILALLITTNVQAAMMLDNAQSTISFVSIKKSQVAEVHSFSKMSGGLSDEGKLDISIELDSVQTKIDIRDTRMRDMLFETMNFPNAVLTTTISDVIPEGQPTSIQVEAELALHGVSKPITINAVALRAGDQLLVTSTQAIIINANDFKLEGGVEALRDIAELNSISMAVPVSFTLVFK